MTTVLSHAPSSCSLLCIRLLICGSCRDNGVYDDVSAVNNAFGDSLQYPICVMRLSSSASVASMAITAICSVYDLVWPRAKLLGEGVFV